MRDSYLQNLKTILEFQNNFSIDLNYSKINYNLLCLLYILYYLKLMNNTLKYI